MIDSLRGTVSSIYKDSFVLDVSGFGIEVFPTKALFAGAAVGEELTCFAYMQISDSGLAMFGFASQMERELFLELLHVKTVGGKLAITLMRSLDPGRIVEAVRNGNVSMLSVPGLGAKRAERICFELKPKIDKKFADLGASALETGGTGALDSFVAEALAGLGFTHGECVRAIATAKAQAEDDVSWNEESLLMASLGILQRR